MYTLPDEVVVRSFSEDNVIFHVGLLPHVSPTDLDLLTFTSSPVAKGTTDEVWW